MEEVDGEEQLQPAKTFQRRIEVVPMADPFYVESAQSISSKQSVRRDLFTPAQAMPDVHSPINDAAENLQKCQESTAQNSQLKFAFVAANKTYHDDVGALDYTEKDAVAIRDALSQSGFSVTHCENLSRIEMLEALNLFRDRLIAASKTNEEVSVVFYYSGHGLSLESSDKTFVLPIDFSTSNLIPLDKKGINIDWISTSLASAKPTRLIFIFDACRASLTVDGLKTKGLSQRFWKTKGHVITAYANSWGETTIDDGAYAKSLAAWIKEPHDRVEEVFNSVQEQIHREKGRRPEHSDQNATPFAFHSK